MDIKIVIELLEMIQNDFTKSSEEVLKKAINNELEPLELAEYIDINSKSLKTAFNLVLNVFYLENDQTYSKASKLLRTSLKAVFQDRIKGDLKEYLELSKDETEEVKFLNTCHVSIEASIRKGEQGKSYELDTKNIIQSIINGELRKINSAS